MAASEDERGAVGADPRQEELVRAARRLLQRSQVFVHATDPILVEDLDGRVIDLDDEAIGVYGWSRGELLGQPVTTVIPPEWHAWAADLRERCLRGEFVRHVEGVRWNREGQRRPMLLTLCLLHDEGGRPIAIATLARDVHELRRAQERQQEALQAALHAEERERRLLAEDLHDSLGQLVPLARLRLAALRDAVVDPDLASRLQAIDALLADSETQIRALTFQLHPTVLHEEGLVAAVERLGEELGRRYGLRVSVRDDALPKPLVESHRLALFRSLQEVLINVARHAGVDKADIELTQEDDVVTVVVEDEGYGFTQAAQAQGFGLRSARERLEGVGGGLELASEAGRGTRLRLWAPLPEESAG